MDVLPRDAVLLLVDVQKGLDDPALGDRNNPSAEQNMARLLEAWRNANRPVFHVRHLSLSPTSPLRPSQSGVAIKDEVKPLPGEPLFQKQVNSAFIGTDLEEQLRRRGCDTLIIVGLTTPHCISTTARMAGNLGFATYVVSDATAAFELVGPDGKHYSAEEVHNLSLATLNHEFAEVVDTDAVLQALM